MKLIPIFLLGFMLVNNVALTGQATIEVQSPLSATVHNLELKNTAPQKFAPFSSNGFATNTYNDVVSYARYFDVNTIQINEIIIAHYPFIEVEIPIADTIITVQLFPSEINSNNLKLTNSNGSQELYDGSIHYRGIIKNNNASLVALSFFENKISGIISSPDIGNIVIAPLKSSSIHVIYNDNDLLIPNLISCATIDEETIISMPYGPADVVEISPCVRVFIEADFEMFEEEGGTVQTADQIVGLFNVSSTIFFNEGITAIISEIFIWTVEDPYPTSSSYDALVAFQDYRTSFDGDIAHLITYDDENLGGVAWLPALCSSFNYAYSNIYNFYYDFPTYSWTIDVFTHEMGHNLGSPHTHNCGWPGGAIDDCYTTEGGCDPGPTPFDGGTIMSYCHLTGYGKNFSFGFGDLPGDLIFDEVNSAGCLGGCELPPSNDWPCSPINLPVNENCLLIDATNIGAINSVIPMVGCDGSSTGDVWFSVTIPAEGYTIIDTDHGDVIDDMGMKVYSGVCTDLSGYPAGCIADGSTYSPLMPGFTIIADPGTVFLLRLWEVGDDAFGNFSICAYTACAPSISPDGIDASETIICAGESSILSVDDGALGTDAIWNWYADDCTGLPIGTGETITVSPSVNTTYFVQAIGECGTTTCVSKTILVSPNPAAPIILNTNCILIIESVVGATYTWYQDGIEIIGETNDTLIITEAGEYSVELTTATGCSVASAAISGDCQEVSITQIDATDIIIYPNPANGEFMVAINNYVGFINCTIINLTGQIIYDNGSLINAQNNVIKFELDIAPGLYYITFEHAGLTTDKIIVIE